MTASIIMMIMVVPYNKKCARARETVERAPGARAGARAGAALPRAGAGGGARAKFPRARPDSTASTLIATTTSKYDLALLSLLSPLLVVSSLLLLVVVVVAVSRALGVHAGDFASAPVCRGVFRGVAALEGADAASAAELAAALRSCPRNRSYV